jgi:hypothetical protein
VDPTLKDDLKGKNSADAVDYEQIEGDTEVLEEAGHAEVKEDLGFVEVESTVNDRTTRQTQVVVNEERGLNRLLSEDAGKTYKSEEKGGDDDLSLAIYSGGKTIELDLHEVRVLQNYLKKKQTAANDNQTLEKAA